MEIHYESQLPNLKAPKVTSIQKFKTLEFNNDNTIQYKRFLLLYTF
jgi:hypothetical protein